MNAFVKDLFSYSAGWLYYTINGERKFVARFKHRGPVTKAKFVKQLIANHTPAEYFEKLNGRQAPLAILRDADPVWYNQIVNPSN